MPGVVVARMKGVFTELLRAGRHSVAWVALGLRGLGRAIYVACCGPAGLHAPRAGCTFGIGPHIWLLVWGFGCCCFCWEGGGGPRV
jgi:hypothetical protein